MKKARYILAATVAMLVFTLPVRAQETPGKERAELSE